jgi:hypothetical protein
VVENINLRIGHLPPPLDFEPLAKDISGRSRRSCERRRYLMLWQR